MPASSVLWPASPIDPHLRRWMLFVDGENLAIRGQKLAENHKLTLPEGPWFRRNVFLWFPHGHRGINQLSKLLLESALQEKVTRAFYYTSTTGDENTLSQVRDDIWTLGFTPEVFKKKDQNTKAKGVDITMTKDVLSNAFLNNYDVAVLITGDADFRPVIEEVKRLGKIVALLSLVDAGANVSRDLRLSADWFTEIDELFLNVWRALPENKT